MENQTQYTIDNVEAFMHTVTVYKLATSDETRKQFIDLYYYIFEEQPTCDACPSDIEMAIHKVKWMIRLHKANKKTEIQNANTLMKYKMKDKTRVYSSAMNMMITKFNCTDEIAEALIKENPNHIALFQISVEHKQEGNVLIEKTEPIKNKRGRKARK